MLSTGDVQGGLRKLEALLRAIKFPGQVDYSGLSKGDPSASLPIVSYTLTSFSPSFMEQLMTAGLELTGKTDLRFTDTLYKMLRDIFNYKPILTKQQFLQWGFSQRKIALVCDIINLVLQKHNQLKKCRDQCPASHRGDRGRPQPTHPTTEFIRPLVVAHVESFSTYTPNTSHAEALCSSSGAPASHGDVFSAHPPEDVFSELPAEQENTDSNIQLSEVDERLCAVEAHVERLLSGLSRLSILERRLEQAERPRSPQKSEGGDVITISRESWENLMSRVVLLETKLELSNTQAPASPPHQSCVSSNSAASINKASKEDIKDSLERITNMLKSTSNLLKHGDCTMNEETS